MKRILLATDAWPPQVSGVVRTVMTTAGRLRDLGHTVEIVHPGDYRGCPAPFYPEIRLCWVPRRAMRARLNHYRPDHVHIVTEGTIGLAVRAACLATRRKFSTTYATKFPQYMRKLTGMPESWTWAYLRWFHRPAAALMASTPSLERELREHGFRNRMARWSRGVDLTLFRPREKRSDYERPVQLYAGRVSVEKGIEDFLRLPTAGTKIVVGDGPGREALQRQYPKAVFPGYKSGEELAALYADADVFVFPSKTDTFGLVMIEAMACGVPVAGYPVPGPIDVLTNPKAGAMDEDLAVAVERALAVGDPAECISLAKQFTWENATRQLLEGMVGA